MARQLHSYMILFIIAISMLSCKEEYRNIDAAPLNIKIRNNHKIKTATDLVYAYDTALISRTSSNAAKLSVISKSIGNNRFEITAIVNIYDDDELKAEKIVMIAERQGGFWHVFEIRYNWRNQDGYGHTDWGIYPRPTTPNPFKTLIKQPPLRKLHKERQQQQVAKKS